MIRAIDCRRNAIELGLVITAKMGIVLRLYADSTTINNVITSADFNKGMKNTWPKQKTHRQKWYRVQRSWLKPVICWSTQKVNFRLNSSPLFSFLPQYIVSLRAIHLYSVKLRLRPDLIEFGCAACRTKRWINSPFSCFRQHPSAFWVFFPFFLKFPAENDLFADKATSFYFLFLCLKIFSRQNKCVLCLIMTIMLTYVCMYVLHK